MQLLLPGEIQKSTAEIIDAERAARLGRYLREKLGNNLEYRVTLEVDNGKVPSYMIGVGGECGEWLDEISDIYRDMLSQSGVEFDRLVHWLIPGVNGSNIPWHTDNPGDIRFMLNIGQAATHVDVATQWNPDHYYPGDPTEREPEMYEALVMDVAEMYMSNALVTNGDVLRPHQTPIDLGRLMLRTSLYAAKGWEYLATGDGVAIALQYAA